MKKIINLIAVTLLLLGCSSGDGKVEPTLSYFNLQDERLKGIWYLDKVIQADGTIEDYIHACSTQRDNADFQYNDIQLYYYFSDCDDYLLRSCDQFQTSGFSVNGATCDDLFEGTYTYTNTNNNPTLRLDYDEVEFFGYEDNNMITAKGVIFSRD